MATVNAAEILNDMQRGWIEPSLRYRADTNYAPSVCIAQPFTIPASSLALNSIVRLFKFPAGAYIKLFRCTPSDMDTHVSPTLNYSIITTDDSDVTALTFISASQKARAASGSDILDDALIGRYVGNQWCSFLAAAAAATAAAGTIKVFCEFSVGVINRNARGLYLKDAEA